jgi:hypothetical protein
MIQGKVIELNGIILSAQSSALEANVAQFSLLDRVRQLEAEIAGLKAWDGEKQRYELTDIGDGNFAYILKAPMRGAEPPHYFCANCYREGRASILQHMRTHGMGDLLMCPSCKTKFVVSRGYEPPA